MTRDEIKIMMQDDPEALCDLVLELQEKLEKLENQTAKDSHNSSKRIQISSSCFVEQVLHMAICDHDRILEMMENGCRLDYTSIIKITQFLLIKAHIKSL